MGNPFLGSVIIVGAGVFGLSTALAIAKRYPSTKVIIIDRKTPPVHDGTSVDTSRILRPGRYCNSSPSSPSLTVSDYINEHYADLAEKAQDIIRNHADLRLYYYEHGFSFVTDGQSSELDTLFHQMLENVKAKQSPSKWKEFNSPEAVFQNLHGEAADVVPDHVIGNKRKWVKGYLSRRCAAVNAEAMV
jgi:sarcosine oxidase / L-pipecolate oxidase